MDFNLILSILGYILVPISSIVTWIVSGRKRKNDALSMLQSTIDNLVGKNTELTNNLIEQNDAILSMKKAIGTLANENITLKEGQEKMLAELNALRKENKELKTLIQANKRNS
jgi:cell shape-determining protein MreC